MPRLSSPLTELRDHYAAVVVGSGYGGAIAACRLARCGLEVCVLERGSERWPGEYPDTFLEGTRELQVTTAAHHFGSRLGLFDLHTEPKMNVLVGCGLGGTSLINANVSIVPDERLWELPCWPDALKQDVTKGLAAGFARAHDMLRPTPFPTVLSAQGTRPPRKVPTPPKLTALERSAQAAGVGAEFHRTFVNVVFEAGLNAAGVHQDACTRCGDCVSGCNVGAKTTTLMTYLPDAKAHGAEIFTEARVRYVSRDDANDRWVVAVEPVSVGRERFGAPEVTITAGIVVLAAGSLGSTEILLRSAERGLPLSGQLGRGFSGNGDILGFAYDSNTTVDGIGFGRHRRAYPVGPTITGIIDLRDGKPLEKGEIVEEGAIPGALAVLMPAAFDAGALYNGRTANPTVLGTVYRVLDSAVSLVAGPRHGAMKRTLTWLVMGHDDNGGRLRLENDRVRVDWRKGAGRRDFDHVDQLLRRLSAGLKARFVRDPIWSKDLNRSLITIHPLGGCGLAERAQRGVVNHRCQVFAGTSGTRVYESLFVMDGSIIPVSLGVNPLLTISALAERAVAMICDDCEKEVDATTVTAPIELPSPTNVGLRFTETLRGTVTVGDATTPMTCTVTIEADDLEALLADPSTTAAAVGTVEAPGLSRSPLTVTGGTFRLFVPDPSRVDTQRMEYRLPFVGPAGERWFLAGDKTLDTAGPFRAWRQTTTLAVRLHNGSDESGPLIGAGTLTVSPLDFARQLTTMDVTNAHSGVERRGWLARFGGLFGRELVERYAGVAAPAQLYDPDAPGRVRRPLDIPAGVEHSVMTQDGKELRLIHFQGGDRGPVLAVHGAGVSSEIFWTDLPRTNMVEYLCKRGWDVWAFDFRASTALPTSKEEFTADYVAEYDHPAAVAKVLELTGAKELKAVVHCFGSNTFVMSLLRGWTTGVRSMVCSQVAAHLKVRAAHRAEAALWFPNVLESLGVRTLSAYVDTNSGWRSRALDALLRFQPFPAHQHCHNPVCHRVTFLYGLLYQHEQLGQAIHDALHELFGVTNMTSLEQLAAMIRRGHVVDAHGCDNYLTDENVKHLDFPVLLFSGSENQCYDPVSTQLTYELLSKVNGPSQYERQVVAGYGHIDGIFGQNAARDVYPMIEEFLART